MLKNKFDTLRDIATTGMSKREAAVWLGVSYSYLRQFTAKHGIVFERPTKLSDAIERNNDICRRHEAGETLQSIADSYGITRERVRQIVERAGLEPKRVIRAKEIAAEVDVVATLAKDGATVSEVAEATGLPRHRITGRAARGGIKLERDTIARRESERLAQVLARIAAGSSIHAACEGDHSFECIVNNYLHKNTAWKPKHGRWRDFSGRHEIARRMVESGANIGTIVEAIRNSESDRPVVYSAVYNWLINHGYHKATTRGAKLPKPHKPKKPDKPAPQSVVIDLGEYASVKEACVALKGKHSASRIAAALGITRNAVIGHWFRARA